MSVTVAALLMVITVFLTPVSALLQECQTGHGREGFRCDEKCVKWDDACDLSSDCLDGTDEKEYCIPGWRFN